MILTRAPRGTKDVLPSESYKWQYVEGILRGVAKDFGYEEIRFPTLEHTELFERGVGDTTDVVQKEMYTFLDKGGRSVTLRPEGTASVVRSYLENSLHAAGLPVKVYYIAPNFRYEKPQAGRLREHHQFGVENIGSQHPSADAEVMGLAHAYLKRLGIRGISLEINSIGCPDCRPNFHEALKAYFGGQKDKLCETCLDRFDRNPLRILDCKSGACQALAERAPVGLDYLCDECRAHFESVKAYLGAMDIGYTVNPRIVRGLDYYTRTVFEFVSTHEGTQYTVCGGGRYDGLISALGGQPTPALGFGSGIERLLLVMETQGVPIPKPDPCLLFVACLGEAAELPVQKLVYALRSSGVQTERDTTGRSLKAQMKYADRLGARFSAVVGEDETVRGVIRLKNMATGEERECPLDADAIQAHLLSEI